MHPAGGVQGQRLAFAKGQKPRDMVDVGVGQHDAGDRAVTRPVNGVKRR